MKNALVILIPRTRNKDFCFCLLPLNLHANAGHGNHVDLDGRPGYTGPLRYVSSNNSPARFAQVKYCPGVLIHIAATIILFSSPTLKMNNDAKSVIAWCLRMGGKYGHTGRLTVV